MIVCAYGMLLPKAILELPKRGCWNIHASLLPRWRGAAPIHRAILAGDQRTGVTIMNMEAGLDTGPMTGFSTDAVDAAFLADKPAWKSVMISTLGHGDPASIFDRSPRPDFDTFNSIV